MPNPVHVLELRSVRGTGGGPEKTILLGAARTDAARARITVAYIRDLRDDVFGVDAWAANLGIDYVELRERHSLDPTPLRELVRLIRARRIDIVHAHDYKANALAWAACRLTGAVPISTEHGWTGHSWRERRLYYPLDKQVVRAFPLVMAVSEDIRQELIGAGARPDQVRTVLNGIDADTFRRDPGRRDAVRAELAIPANARVLGAVGRLEPQKRFDILLEAFAEVRTNHREAVLVIVGDGGEAETLRRLAETLGIASRCRFTGHRTDVADLHNGFDLLVQSSDYEGTPNAVLEAMALGTPVVATDAGGTRQIVEHERDGLVVACGDRSVLVAAIRRALTHPHEAAAWALEARRRVEYELSFNRRVRTLEEIYEELVTRASRLDTAAATSLGA